MKLTDLPAPDAYGLLPLGIHDSTMEYVERRFGSFQRSDRRSRLFAKLREYVEEIEKAASGATLVVDGSFIMGRIDEPEDIDLILVMPVDWDFEVDLRPFQYNIVSKKRAKRMYGFDVKTVRAFSPEMDYWIEFFSDVNVKWCEQFGIPAGTKKGLVRITL